MSDAESARLLDPVISLRDVYKSFGRNPVLRGVSLDIGKGQVMAIIGRSGSGKSTILRCIDYLEKIDSGSITVCSHRIDQRGVDLRALRLDIGIVFQSYNLFPHLTVEENVMLAPRSVKRVSKPAARELARDMLAQVGLFEKARDYPEQLSGGQQQRVAIARSLAMQPRAMLFDEVTSALDPQLTGEVLRVMEGLAAKGMTMMMVTHEMNFARKVADAIVFMNEGKVWEQGDAGVLTSPQTKELQEFLHNGL